MTELPAAPEPMTRMRAFWQGTLAMYGVPALVLYAGLDQKPRGRFIAGTKWGRDIAPFSIPALEASGTIHVTGTASVQGKDLSTLKINLEIDMNSLYSDTPKLTNHLKSADFFSVKTNPKSKFVSTKVEKSGNDYKITGDLTMCGQTKPLTIPAQVKIEGGALSVTAKFAIDKSNWGMTYGKGQIDNDVSLTVKIDAKAK